MPLTISTATSAIIEPKRTNRWVVAFQEIPGISGLENPLSFACHKGNKPDITFDKKELDRVNEKWKFAGKPTYNQLNFSFYDYIRNDSQSSAFSILKAWSSKVYDPITGQMGYAIEYKTNATIGMLDPKGVVCQTWHIFYTWPTSVKGGELDYGNDDIVSIDLTLEYDYFVMGEETALGNGISGPTGTYPNKFDS